MKWTKQQQERIDRRRNDPAWELATEEEMANTSDEDEAAAKSDISTDSTVTMQCEDCGNIEEVAIDQTATVPDPEGGTKRTGTCSECGGDTWQVKE